VSSLSVVHVVICVVVGLAAAGAGAADVAVLPLAGRQSVAEREALTTALREELRALDVDVLDGPATGRVMAGASALSGACPVTTTDCALQLGGLAGVATVVVGATDSGQLTLRALDVARQLEVGRVVVPIDMVSPRATVRLAAIRLLRPEREVGHLALFVNVDGATVSVDGRVVGRTPIDLLPLRPGAHEVVVDHPRHDSEVVRVDIALASTATLHVDLKGAATTDDVASAPVHADVFRQVVVLDVRPPPMTRDDDVRLLAALTTLMIVNELQRRDGVVVITPADVARALGPRHVDLVGCMGDDGCLQRVLGETFNGDVVLAALIEDDHGTTLAARRLDLATGDTAASYARHVPISPTQRQRLAALAPALVDGLFVELDRRRGVDPDPTLIERLRPPPVPVVGFVAAASTAVVGVALTVGAVAGWADATARRDPAALVWGAGVVGGGVVTAAGVSSSIIVAAAVDWAGHAAQNEALLDDVEARAHSSR
jgi:hypothetical protein